MTKAEFIAEIEKFKPLIKGKGGDIADSIGISRVKFMNYCRGGGPDEALMEKILDALAAYKEELVEYINNNW